MSLVAATAVVAAAVAKADNTAAPAEDFWLTNLLSNMFSFALVIAPAWLVIRHVRNNPDIVDRQGILSTTLRRCVLGQDEDMKMDVVKSDSSSSDSNDTFAMQALKLGFCVLGLQGSYLTWGVLQEQIMTQDYDGERFTTSQFLVFVNRILAFLSAIFITSYWQQPKHTVPLYKYSFTSLSNVMSSWFQYEALKYVSFPTQVLAKASKVIPVMLMGKMVQGKEYPMWEYGIAGMLSVGTAVFMFSKDPGSETDHEKETTLAGMFLLVGYMMFDSFTSNYQDGLFKTYKMSKFQMMFGVNLFSCFFTLWSLLNRGKFFPAIAFTLRHPNFFFHVIILSITSATGQLFIFHTIATYGPLVFTIIMTTRQIMSIFLSAVIFNHSFSAQGWFGVGIVCFTLVLRIYYKHQERKAKNAMKSAAASG